MVFEDKKILFCSKRSSTHLKAFEDPPGMLLLPAQVCTCPGEPEPKSCSFHLPRIGKFYESLEKLREVWFLSNLVLNILQTY